MFRHIRLTIATLGLVVLMTACSATATLPPKVAETTAPADAARVSTGATDEAATTVQQAKPTSVATNAPTATVAIVPTNTPAATSTPVPVPVPVVTSPTNPNPSVWYNVKTVTVSWKVPSTIPIDGFGYVVDQSAAAPAPQEMSTRDRSATLSDLKDGTWYFHIRAHGAAGTWSDTTSFKFNVDQQPALTVTTPKFSAFYFNPSFFKQDYWFDVSRPANVSVAISSNNSAVRTMTSHPAAAGEVDLTWDGRDDKGGIAPEGPYVFTVTAKDDRGHTATSQASGVGITYDKMVISLSKQSLTAYDGNTQFLTTLVTTGNQALPTPVGTFPVLAKYHPFTMHSPWPKGSPFYYVDSPVNYAMLFDNAGYYVHDAPWRSDYGPGSNTRAGTPGQGTTGTHGCVNVPLPVEVKLFNWAPTGAVVQVVP